jgi:5-methylcytosine-specific restriction endonuclease McrA
MARARVSNPNSYYGWRQRVFARDGSKCVQCGSAQHLQSDHIKPFSTFPDLRYDVSNGRVLCHDCHKKTDTYGGKQLLGRRVEKDPYGSR